VAAAWSNKQGKKEYKEATQNTWQARLENFRESFIFCLQYDAHNNNNNNNKLIGAKIPNMVSPPCATIASISCI
jgi:hypothetical protein